MFYEFSLRKDENYAIFHDYACICLFVVFFFFSFGNITGGSGCVSPVRIDESTSINYMNGKADFLGEK